MKSDCESCAKSTKMKIEQYITHYNNEIIKNQDDVKRLIHCLLSLFEVHIITTADLTATKVEETVEKLMYHENDQVRLAANMLRAKWMLLSRRSSSNKTTEKDLHLFHNFTRMFGVAPKPNPQQPPALQENTTSNQSNLHQKPIEAQNAEKENRPKKIPRKRLIRRQLEFEEASPQKPAEHKPFPMSFVENVSQQSPVEVPVINNQTFTLTPLTESINRSSSTQLNRTYEFVREAIYQLQWSQSRDFEEMWKNPNLGAIPTIIIPKPQKRKLSPSNIQQNDPKRQKTNDYEVDQKIEFPQFPNYDRRNPLGLIFDQNKIREMMAAKPRASLPNVPERNHPNVPTTSGSSHNAKFENHRNSLPILTTEAVKNHKDKERKSITSQVPQQNLTIEAVRNPNDREIQPTTSQVPQPQQTEESSKNSASNDPSDIFVSKQNRVKVCSGTKSREVASQFELYIKSCQERIEDLSYPSNMPAKLVQAILAKAQPAQLRKIERKNPEIAQKTDSVWETIVKAKFKGATRKGDESYREMYERCTSEQSDRLLSLTHALERTKQLLVPTSKVAIIDPIAPKPKKVTTSHRNNEEVKPKKHAESSSSSKKLESRTTEKLSTSGTSKPKSHSRSHEQVKPKKDSDTSSSSRKSDKSEKPSTSSSQPSKRSSSSNTRKTGPMMKKLLKLRKN